jgi:glycosyltransferase involved in cell wall biosynthesis
MSEEPRILLAVTVAYSLKLLGNLPNYLAGSGWDVHLVSGPGIEQDFYEKSTVTTHSIESRRNPSPISDLVSFVEWLRLLRTVKPDIVAIGTPKAAFLGIMASWLVGVPIRVYTLRGLRLETVSGPIRTALFLAERFTSTLATHIVAVSPSLQEKYVQIKLAPKNKIRVLGAGSSHGIDKLKFRRPARSHQERLRKEIGLSTGVPVLGFVGRFGRDKGSTTILETRKFLSEKGIDHEFLLIGSIEGPQESFESLARWGRKPKHISPSGEIAPFYALVDILLLPTKREGFPNVVLEAGAMGVPTVTTDATGAVDAVMHGVTGLVSELVDPQSFPKLVAFLLENPIDRARLGVDAQKWVLETFDETIILRDTEEFYRSLLPGSSEIS